MGAGAAVSAIERVYEERYHAFLRVAEALVGDPDLAHDAVQNGFARALDKRRSFRGDGSLEGWLWRTVVSAARNTRRRLPPPTEAFDETLPRPCANGGSNDDVVRGLVASLPERQRIVLFLRYYADLDYESIAAALSISPGTVGATLNHAHSAVRRRLQEVSP